MTIIKFMYFLIMKFLMINWKSLYFDSGQMYLNLHVLLILEYLKLLYSCRITQ